MVGRRSRSNVEEEPETGGLKEEAVNKKGGKSEHRQEGGKRRKEGERGREKERCLGARRGEKTAKRVILRDSTSQV